MWADSVAHRRTSSASTMIVTKSHKRVRPCKSSTAHRVSSARVEAGLCAMAFTKAVGERGWRPLYSRLTVRLGRTVVAWPAGEPPRGPPLWGLPVGGEGRQGSPLLELCPQPSGGAGVWDVSPDWHWPGVMPPSLEGGSLGLAPSGAGLPGTPVSHPSWRWSVSFGSARMPSSLEGGITGNPK